jgi:hypothetical protein
MTYEQISELIDTNLASGQKIPALKHREVEHALLDYIQASLAQSGDIKRIKCDLTYYTANFEVDGLGKNLRLGWAQCNGNNGTDDLTGRVGVGYGLGYSTFSAPIGSNSVSLLAENIPKLDVTLPVSNADNGGGSKIYIMATDLEGAGTKTYLNTIGSSTPTAINVMQKGIVNLYIMKL